MAEKPIINRRDGNISISVFKKEKDGKGYYSVCLQRSYKAKDAQDWTREQINLFPDDLLKLANLSRCAYTDIVAHAQQNKATATEYPAQTFDDAVPF